MVIALGLSWMAVGFMGAALTLLAVAVYPVRKDRLWVAAAACLFVSCVMGVLIFVPAWVLWGYLDELAPVFAFLRTLPRG